MAEQGIEVVSYEALAAEYYDSAKHPTCANFGLASRRLLCPLLDVTFMSGDRICEVGPGRSSVAEWLHGRGEKLNQLILVESSRGMARYSQGWVNAGAQLFHADARRMPLKDSSVSIVVASLGDPYNDLAFWREARRVLKRNGVVLFTTPAFEWAEGFRGSNGNAVDLAEFELSDGRLVGVPSLVRAENDQLSMIRDSGLDVVKIAHATVHDLAGERLSSKLVTEKRRDHRPIVTAYFAVAE
ncbi:methyltransferase domain-containing protein [Mycobacterium avium]|uniref:methyltransferase domain-containing protein n=1 Tax=Mycobacterium avium TaxID=1764 RepID=UPI0009C0E460|nr:methyltransferase domain-containing protein [Mycobacterium avium]